MEHEIDDQLADPEWWRKLDMEDVVIEHGSRVYQCNFRSLIPPTMGPPLPHGFKNPLCWFAKVDGIEIGPLFEWHPDDKSDLSDLTRRIIARVAEIEATKARAP